MNMSEENMSEGEVVRLIEQMVEIIAREMCIGQGLNADEIIGVNAISQPNEQMVLRWHTFRRDASSALRAFDKLRIQGYV